MSLMLAWGGANVQNFLLDLEGFGFFEYVLPFLLIFAVVYAILSQIEIFKKNKGVSTIIALSIGLLALWQGMVAQFFAQIFPRLGIGISILLVALILFGAFVPLEAGKSGWGKYIFMGIGMLAFLIILFSSAEAYDWWGGSGWVTENLSLIVVLLVIIGGIVGVILSQRDKISKVIPGV